MKRIIGPSIIVYKNRMNPKKTGISRKQVSTQNIFHGVYTNTSQRISKMLIPGIHKRMKSRIHVQGAVINTNGNSEKT